MVVLECCLVWLRTLKECNLPLMSPWTSHLGPFDGYYFTFMHGNGAFVLDFRLDCAYNMPKACFWTGIPVIFVDHSHRAKVKESPSDEEIVHVD